MCRALHRKLSTAIVALSLLLSPMPARADPWVPQIELARGTPGGLIQVRENNVQGSALPLGPGLGIDYVQRVALGIEDDSADGQAFILKLDLARLHGRSESPTPVNFNGVQLAAGRPLTSDASWLNDWQLTGLYRRQLTSDTGGTGLAAEIGFTYAGLTYDLQGHPSHAANPVELSGSRTSEDFVTQELPVPQLGLEFRYRLPGSWWLEANALGGHLPRLYSLRNEGGKVFVTQTNQQTRLGFAYHPTYGLRLGFGWYSRYFMQSEDSAEDGNYIRWNEHGIYLDFSLPF